MNTKEAYKIELNLWEIENLKNGRYFGKESKYFPYKVGNYIPINERYSAMLEFKHAKSIENALKKV